jgi:transposase
MAHIRHRVTLSEEEIGILEDILDRGKHSAQKRKRARAMLLAHQGMTDPENAAISGMRVRSIEDMRRHFVEMGFEPTLNGVPKKPRGKKITGANEARLIALACETKPDGHSHWSLRLLQEKFLSLENVTVDSVSHETIRKTLKKTTSSLGKGGSGASRQKPARNS